MAPDAALTASITLNGEVVDLALDATLLDALRETQHCYSVKDGCSPQGQCGCCTVLVDEQPRVACVTPVRRVAGRTVTTLEGVDPDVLQRMVSAFEATGAAQCGFCTPGIVSRLIGLSRKGVPSEKALRTALAAHLCRCTGFQPIVEAALLALDPTAEIPPARDRDLASQRATLESGVSQRVGPEVITGRFPFAADTQHAGMVAYATADGGYALGTSISDARTKAEKRQGRNSTVGLKAPLEIPHIEGTVLALRTCFLEPAYLEPDASYAEAGGVASTPFANAGAFGAKRNSPIGDDACELSQQQGCGVLCVWPREEVVRRGAKRPPIALALRADGSGVLRIARTARSDDLAPLLETVARMFPEISSEVVDLAGPRVGISHRGAVVAELLAARCLVHHREGEAFSVSLESGAKAEVAIGDDGISVRVEAGNPLCEVTLRSYVMGAVHQAYGQVTSEGLAVDDEGQVHDLTIRSFGITTALQVPPISVTLVPSDAQAVAAGLAVYAATLAAVWFYEGMVTHWPTRREVQ